MKDTIAQCIRLLQSQQNYLSGKVNLMDVLTAQTLGKQIEEKLQSLLDNPANLHLTPKQNEENGRK